MVDNTKAAKLLILDSSPGRADTQKLLSGTHVVVQKHSEEHSQYSAQFSNDTLPVQLHLTVDAYSLAVPHSTWWDNGESNAIIILAFQNATEELQPTLSFLQTHLGASSPPVHALLASGNNDADFPGSVTVHKLESKSQVEATGQSVLASVLDALVQSEVTSGAAKSVAVALPAHSSEQFNTLDRSNRKSIRSCKSIKGRQTKAPPSPSSKYQIQSVSSSVIQKAMAPSNPTLPRRQPPSLGCTRAQLRPPMESGLRGMGRAGKYGELRELGGAVYRGEVLAGRPHGQGQFLVPTGRQVHLQATCIPAAVLTTGPTQSTTLYCGS